MQFLLSSKIAIVEGNDNFNVHTMNLKLRFINLQLKLYLIHCSKFLPLCSKRDSKSFKNALDVAAFNLVFSQMITYLQNTRALFFKSWTLIGESACTTVFKCPHVLY